jgi:hypothetical protein
LQLKRKQLKPTVVPEDNSQRLNSQLDPSVAIELLQEITVETAPNRLATGDLRVDGRIGEGIHSCVSLGTLRRDNNGSARQVAVKDFRHQHAAPPVNVLRAFQQEYRILERCRSQNGRQHVVEILGVTLEPRLTFSWSTSAAAGEVSLRCIITAFRYVKVRLTCCVFCIIS